mmetsp:Transcript_46782/g.146036  ORF Transcript_46782/g.146036 Transcript_46782/m.146036 type:complete len:264 (+) Transcript_46782:1199-1990(+)
MQRLLRGSWPDNAAPLVPVARSRHPEGSCLAVLRIGHDIQRNPADLCGIMARTERSAIEVATERIAEHPHAESHVSLVRFFGIGHVSLEIRADAHHELAELPRAEDVLLAKGLVHALFQGLFKLLKQRIPGILGQERLVEAPGLARDVRQIDIEEHVADEAPQDLAGVRLLQEVGADVEEDRRERRPQAIAVPVNEHRRVHVVQPVPLRIGDAPRRAPRRRGHDDDGRRCLARTEQRSQGNSKSQHGTEDDAGRAPQRAAAQR